ncbi:LysM peptidoglycan-binding domain-containing protein [Larkinella bovis]|uniref:LysM peptidoglycan-binding domain-containing protein n=1 Tax=Larkinella bovis TaxID=683041 RepID=A0ABW0I689_9BACT
MNNYVVKAGQSLLDIAVEVYGDVEGVHWLIEDNPMVYGATDRLRAGQVLVVRPETVNFRYQAYLQEFAPFATITKDDQPEGVGYWWFDEYTIQ